MTIEDVFWMTPPAPNAKGDLPRTLAAMVPGTVLMGELTGTGILKPGDFVVHEKGRFEIQRIEVFHQFLDRVEPPRWLGLRLGTHVDRALFGKGERLRFER